jgi:prepilin-type N-terminal cleavage/methylation domain-containing protein
MTVSSMRPSSAARGFTLIEILVVMAIIALLLGVLVMNSKSMFTAGSKTKTQSRIHELRLQIEEYQRVTGSYPPSSLQEVGLKSENDINEGIEACVASMMKKDYQGSGHPDENTFKNTDGDAADTDFSILGSRDLFEVVDHDENPIVYINFKDYAKSFTYYIKNPSTQEYEPHTVTAHKSKRTGGYSNFDSYQIWSAGPDGEFNTDDDIANFDLEKE